MLRGGTHYLDGSPLHLNETHSGLTIQNYPNETAFVSGAVPLTNLAWEKHHGSIFRAHLGAEYDSWLGQHQLLGLRVDGGRAIRARYPDADPEQGFGPGLLPNGALPIDNSNQRPLTDIYPTVPDRTASGAVATFARFNLGVGGPCEKFVRSVLSLWCLSKCCYFGARVHPDILRALTTDTASWILVRNTHSWGRRAAVYRYTIRHCHRSRRRS